MTLPTEEDPVRTGVSRQERRARRQGAGREINHLEDVQSLVATVGFNPYPELTEVDNVS